MKASKKMDLVLDSCPPILVNNPEFELHVSPSIYVKLCKEFKKNISHYKGHPIIIERQAALDWVMATVK